MNRHYALCGAAGAAPESGSVGTDTSTPNTEREREHMSWHSDYDQRLQRRNREALQRFDRTLSPPERDDSYEECSPTCKLRGLCPGASAEDCAKRRLYAWDY